MMAQIWQGAAYLTVRHGHLVMQVATDEEPLSWREGLLRAGLCGGFAVFCLMMRNFRSDSFHHARSTSADIWTYVIVGLVAAAAGLFWLDGGPG